MGLDLRPTCSKCGKVMDLTDMRAAGDGKFACKDCFEKKNTGFNPLRKDKPQEFKHPKIKPVDHQGVEPIASEDAFFAQKEYLCSSCGYQFKRNPTSQVRQCPFCGKNTVSQKVDLPADDMLQ